MDYEEEQHQYWKTMRKFMLNKYYNGNSKRLFGKQLSELNNGERKKLSRFVGIIQLSYGYDVPIETIKKAVLDDLPIDIDSFPKKS